VKKINTEMDKTQDRMNFVTKKLSNLLKSNDMGTLYTIMCLSFILFILVILVIVT
jgi:tetrahydromethanopterin S-methyltransferase subunit G